MKKIVITGVLVIILILSLTVEKESIVINNNSILPNYITYAMERKVSNLKLTDNTDRRSKDLLLALFEGLVKEDDEGKVVPALAKEYTISEDNIEYVFKLRDDIFYSNGEKIKAEDYRDFLFEFLSDKDNVYSRDLDCIFGVPDFKAGKVKRESVAINCPDNETLVIRLNYPCNELLNILSSPVFALRDYNNLETYKDNYAKIRYTGPFIINSIDNEDLILSKNNKYYDNKLVTNEKIKFAFYDNIGEALAIFEGSEMNNEAERVDILLDIPINEISRLKSDGKIKAFSGNDRYYLLFNNKEDSEVKDINIRYLIQKSLSREKYVSNISKEILSVATTYELNDGTREVFSPNIEASGDKGGETEISIPSEYKLTLLCEKNSLSTQIAEGVEEDIKKAFEIETHIIECSGEDFEEQLSEGNYDIALINFQRKYNYKGEYLQSLEKNSRYNFIKYSNDTYDKLLQKARYEVSEEERNSIYEQCEAILKDDLLSIPLCSIKYPLCIKEDIEGVFITSTGNIKLNNLRIKSN